MISASSNALFGPELPLSHIWGSSGPFVQIALYSIGMAIAFGLFTRVCSFLALVLFTLAVSVYGWYMLTYINYVGEIVVTLILGGGMLSIDHRMSSKSLRSHTIAIRKFFAHIEPYAFLVLRVLFGLAIIYASWYAKIVHSNLALDVVADYHLTNYFHFSPLFLVLGAAIVETVIGIFIMFGLEVRFAALVFLGFLTMSIGFFGEVVWPHLVLYGINLVLIFHGYDRYTLEGHFFKKRTIEPVL